MAFSAGIRKKQFQNEFVAPGVDPYLPVDAYAVAIHMLLERYVDYLAMTAGEDAGRVILESINYSEDARHQLEFARLIVDGTQWVPQSEFQCRIEAGVRFEPKRGSHPLELADMWSRDVYEWLGADCKKYPGRMADFMPKIYGRGDQAHGKFGLKVFPDSDIREQIEAHRAECAALRNA